MSTKKMTEYEINYLVLQSRTKDLEKIREKMKKLISEMGAEVIKEKNYQKRKLAYEIRHELYGFYTVLRFQTEDRDIIGKLTHEINLIPEVSRFIIVRAEELPPLKTKEEEEKEKEQQAEKVDQKTTIRHEEIDKVIQQQKKQEVAGSTANLAETKEEKSEDKMAEASSELSLELSSDEEAKEEAKKDSGNLKEEKQEKKLKNEATKSTPETNQTEELKTKKVIPSTQDEDKSPSKEPKKDDGLEELDKKLDEILNI